MKVRVVYKPDGTVAVIHPAPKSRRPKETEAAWLARVFDKPLAPVYAKNGAGETVQVNPLHGLPFDDIDISELPQTRKYREAWRGEKGIGIVIDQEMKAKIDARPSEEEQKQIALAERIVSLKAARNELTGDAALACQREIERLSQELADA